MKRAEESGPGSVAGCRKLHFLDGPIYSGPVTVPFYGT